MKEDEKIADFRFFFSLATVTFFGTPEMLLLQWFVYFLLVCAMLFNCAHTQNVTKLSACARLTTPNTTYVLQNDLHANLTCLWVLTRHIVIDLNGYTVYFDESPVVSDTMNELGEFENGSAALAALRIEANSTVTGLSSPMCVSVSVNGSIHGSGALRIEPACNAVIVFPPLALQANTSYQIDYVVLASLSNKKNAVFELRNANTSIVVGNLSLPVDDGGYAAQRRSNYIEISQTDMYELVLRINTSVGAGAVSFDSIDVTRGAAYGVLLNPHAYFVGSMWDRLDPLSSTSSSSSGVGNVTLRNGSLRQGAQLAVGSRGIHVFASGVTVQNVSVFMLGRGTEAFGGNCDNIRIEGSRFEFADANDTSGDSLDGHGVRCVDSCLVSIVNNKFVGRGVTVGGYDASCGRLVLSGNVLTMTAAGATAVEVGSTKNSIVSNNMIECDRSQFCTGFFFQYAKANFTVSSNVVRAFATSDACVREKVRAFHLFGRYSLSNVSVTNNSFAATASGACTVEACAFDQYSSDPIDNVSFRNNVCVARWGDANWTIPSGNAVVAVNVMAQNIVLANNTLATSQIHIQTNQAQVDRSSLFRVLDGALAVQPVRMGGCPSLAVRHIDAQFDNATMRSRLEVLPWIGSGCSSRNNFTSATGANIFASTLQVAASPNGVALAAAGVTVSVRNVSGSIVASAPAPSGSAIAELVVDVVVSTGSAVLRGSPFMVLASDSMIRPFEGWTGDPVRLCIDRERIDLCSTFTTTATATTSAPTGAVVTQQNLALTSTGVGSDSAPVDGASSGVLIGAIVGGIVGGVCLALVLGGVYWVVSERKRAAEVHTVEIAEFRSARADGDGDSFRSISSASGLTASSGNTLPSAPARTRDGGDTLTSMPMPGSIPSDYSNIPELLHDEYAVGDII
jgi:hypothetical protein